MVEAAGIEPWADEIIHCPFNWLDRVEIRARPNRAHHDALLIAANVLDPASGKASGMNRA